MTNGEKFQQIFAVSQVDECDLNVYAWLPIHDAIEIPLEWWNANYSEIPTGSTDCISKQAVIDLMMQKWGENFSGDDAMQESIDAIRVMPSVTPQEPQTFKWCTDCKEYDQEKHCCHRWSKVIRDTVEEMKQEQEPILDKLREEIKVMTSNRGFLSCSVGYIHKGIDNVFDKYKAEAEET